MATELFYNELANHYDTIYAKKDYRRDIEFLIQLIPKGTVLDVACGTGMHAKLLAEKDYQVTGIDKNEGMLKIARKRLPRNTFKQADMRYFKLGQKFDSVICMFTAINYMLTSEDLVRTLVNFKQHTKPGGVIVVDFCIPGKHMNHATRVSKNCIALYTGKDEDNVRDLVIYWQTEKGRKIDIIEDHHYIRMYKEKDIISAAKKAKLHPEIHYDFTKDKRKGLRPQLVCRVNNG